MYVYVYGTIVEDKVLDLRLLSCMFILCLSVCTHAALYKTTHKEVYVLLSIRRGVWCGVVWCGVVWCGVVWCGVVWCECVKVVTVWVCAWVLYMCMCL